MNEFENDPPIDDQNVEISNLDLDEKNLLFSRMFQALEKNPSLRKRFWRIGVPGVSVLLVFLVLFSAFPSVKGLALSFFSRQVPTHSNTLVPLAATPVDAYEFDPDEQVVWSLGSSSPFIPSATLGPAPRDCPAISQTHPFDYKGAPRAAGGSPVLVIGFGGRDAVFTNFQHAQPPEIGWYKRIVLLTETNYAGTVTFRGGELRDGTPIWFGMKPHNQGPSTTFTILPLNSSVSNHTIGDEEWGISTANMYIARAGCYFLMATWPQGNWIVYFSAGQ